ncbi:hypothetical protein TNCV_585481 [Trichonephila clavipes]|nr:hypothetical protein TNCV_585481 [Trichonephila clavipes]
MLPTLHWYAGNRPGLAIAFKCSRCSQTTLSHLASGHIKCLIFSEQKGLLDLGKVSRSPGSPEHIMYYMDLKIKDIYTEPFLCWTF